ncbi:fasciclin domain-containing protein [Spirosoma sp. BT702]|uniref:Fasciclin domain-containing protein n=1 Tax=Spirosoma profusum TaxID=2771354 RepID=A0A926Y2A4_9BACT|nr:fasciclin domain-containing protein [Spirosoma profusum]MBD2700790.1 fasciclin domain-containing protein [Spirosoma profusum]
MTTSFPMFLNRFIWLLLVVMAGGSCKKADDAAAPKTITDYIQENNQLSLLRAAIGHAGLGDALKAANLTIFAPNDAAVQAAGFSSEAAIRALPKEQVKALVLYHVLYAPVSTSAIPSGVNSIETASKGIAFLNKTSGGTIYINQAQITQADISVANGTLHVIDKVLNPSTGSLLTALQGNTSLTLLTAALKRISSSNTTVAGILNNTTSTNTVTLFAPNDAAFQSAGYKDVAAINSANLNTLTNTLLYHVLSGVTFSNQFQTNSYTTLLSGNKVNVTATSNQVAIKGNKNSGFATIKSANMATANGVIHVIDQVLLP